VRRRLVLPVDRSFHVQSVYHERLRRPGRFNVEDVIPACYQLILYTGFQSRLLFTIDAPRETLVYSRTSRESRRTQSHLGGMDVVAARSASVIPAAPLIKPGTGLQGGGGS